MQITDLIPVVFASGAASEDAWTDRGVPDLPDPPALAVQPAGDHVEVGCGRRGRTCPARVGCFQANVNRSNRITLAAVIGAVIGPKVLVPDWRAGERASDRQATRSTGVEL